MRLSIKTRRNILPFLLYGILILFLVSKETKGDEPPFESWILRSRGRWQEGQEVKERRIKWGIHYFEVLCEVGFQRENPSGKKEISTKSHSLISMTSMTWTPLLPSFWGDHLRFSLFFVLESHGKFLSKTLKRKCKTCSISYQTMEDDVARLTEYCLRFHSLSVCFLLLKS